MLGINRLVPASADAEITAFGNHVFEPRIAKPAQDFRGAVGRMIINDDNIEVEIRVLPENTLDGIENGSLSIPYRYDDACFYRKCPGRLRHFFEARLEPGTGSFEVRSCHPLHFDLVIAITRIHIIELLLTGRPHICDGRAVQRLRNSHDRVLLRNPKPQIVQASPSPGTIYAGLMRCMNGHSDDRPKVETVTDTSSLI